MSAISEIQTFSPGMFILFWFCVLCVVEEKKEGERSNHWTLGEPERLVINTKTRALEIATVLFPLVTAFKFIDFRNIVIKE